MGRLVVRKGEDGGGRLVERRPRIDEEECWVLNGGTGFWCWHAKYDRYTIGQPASVAFDPDYIWENRKNLIGWVHTHPHFVASPSSTDDATMKANCFALGRPLLCCIDGIDGLKAYWYLNEDADPIKVSAVRIGSKIYGRLPNGYH